MTTQEAQQLIGRKVIYTPRGGCINDRETGVITSVVKNYVFVRFGAELNSKAASARDLEVE